MKNEKQIILISACLLGSKVRYDGQAKEYKNIRKLLDYYDIIPICPEVDGGLKIPRPKAEIVGNKVMNEKGKDRDCDNKNFYWGIVELKGLFEG